MARTVSPSEAWMLNVPCSACAQPAGERCVSAGGNATAAHTTRRALALEQGFGPPENSKSSFQLRNRGNIPKPKPVKRFDEVEVIALADKLAFVQRINGQHEFLVGIARILLELGFKP